jgi:hypothetical protein
MKINVAINSIPKLNPITTSFFIVFNDVLASLFDVWFHSDAQIARCHLKC